MPVLDERSAAFFALGLARQNGRPVLLVCTSGTAGANYLPAVIEARESGVPLLVITADRPPEMRACASGQTVDQQKIFGVYPNFYHELAVPEASLPLLRYLRETVAHAWLRTLQPFAGPVHLNAPFRDPLAPVADGLARILAPAADWVAFFAHCEEGKLESARAVPLPDFGGDIHGLIVAGPAQPADPAAYAAHVGEIARKLGWPVLADALSPARQHGSLIPGLITTYDVILRSETAAERLRPERVLCLGGWPTSKALRGWLEASDALTWLVGEQPDNRDALHGRTQVLPMSVRFLALALEEPDEPNGYGQMWAESAQRVRAGLGRNPRVRGRLV